MPRKAKGTNRIIVASPQRRRIAVRTEQPVFGSPSNRFCTLVNQYEPLSEQSQHRPSQPRPRRAANPHHRPSHATSTCIAPTVAPRPPAIESALIDLDSRSTSSLPHVTVARQRHRGRGQGRGLGAAFYDRRRVEDRIHPRDRTPLPPSARVQHALTARLHANKSFAHAWFSTAHHRQSSTTRADRPERIGPRSASLQPSTHPDRITPSFLATVAVLTSPHRNR